jgi:2-succinyl-6-hydroxy-2,4-cyclohexadiene-1-carboxylate synthase
MQLIHRAEPIVEKQIPTLFLTGEEDVLLPPRLVGRVAGQIPHALFVKIPGVGHSAYFERPEEFNRIVLEFLRQSAQGSP